MALTSAKRRAVALLAAPKRSDGGSEGRPAVP